MGIVWVRNVTSSGEVEVLSCIVIIVVFSEIWHVFFYNNKNLFMIFMKINDEFFVVNKEAKGKKNFQE